MTNRNAFTVKEIASRNGVSHVTVYKEINEDRLRSFKIGKSRRITVEAEREWIEQREAEARVAA